MTKHQIAKMVIGSNPNFEGVSYWRRVLCFIGACVPNKTDYHTEDFPVAEKSFDPCKHCGRYLWRND